MLRTVLEKVSESEIQYKIRKYCFIKTSLGIEHSGKVDTEAMQLSSKSSGIDYCISNLNSAVDTKFPLSLVLACYFHSNLTIATI
jgi:hypothetical protein